MPIKVPNNLPAVKALKEENVFVMTDTRAMTQDIRPLQILILNLMPTKIDTETQLTRLLGNTPLQVELELLQTSSHKVQNTSEEHMIAFYKTFDQIKHKYYDGLIITGAPVELLEFEEVEYWDELCEIMEWSKSHVHSTFHICWGAQAGLYYHYGIKKHRLPKKLSGVYKHHLDYSKGMLFRGFDDEFYVPHSRNTDVDREDVEKVSDLRVISSSYEAGIYAIKSKNDRQIFIMGHSEYDGDTLYKEYVRDKGAGLNPEVPCNYFPDDDDTKEPVVKWRSCANLLYSNWLNYFVYQSTPYDLTKIQADAPADIYQERAELKVAKFGGSSLADGEQLKKAIDIITGDQSRRYVVVSAPGRRFDGDVKVTDMLMACAAEAEKGNLTKAEALLEEVKARFKGIAASCDIKDDSAFDVEKEFAVIREAVADGAGKAYIVSRGEYLGAKLFSGCTGYDFVDAAGMIFFNEDGICNEIESEKAVAAELEEHERAVIPGFYGCDESGNVQVFSRGGSDITGAIVAAAVGADLYENWSDVSGLLMANPAIVDNPLTVPVITYKELREMAYMGAEVMHEDAIKPVARVEVPVNIRNTNRPSDHGTMIVKNADYYNNALDISGISGKSGYTAISLEKTGLNDNSRYRTDILRVFASRGVKIKNLLSGIDSLNIIVGEKLTAESVQELTEAINRAVSPDSITVNEGLSIIAIIGRDISVVPTIAVRVLQALANKKINISLIDHGSGNMNMIVGVSDDDVNGAIQAIYNEFAKVGSRE